MSKKNTSPDQPSTTETKPRSMGVALGHGVSAGILGMLALIAVLVAGVPLATGASAFTVTGSAMEPGLPAGALVVTRPVDAHHLDVGDVIVAPEQILGRLWYSIPVLGWVNIAVAGPFRFALVPAVAAAICAYATLVLVARSRRRRTAS